MVLLFSVASVSAQENTTDTVKVTNDNDDVKVHSDSDTNLSTAKSDDILTASDNNDNLSSSDSSDILTGTGSFSQLYNKVKSGGIIDLTDDYSYPTVIGIAFRCCQR